MKSKRAISRSIIMLLCLSVLVCLSGCGTSAKKETKKAKSTKKKSTTTQVEMVDPLEEGIGESTKEAPMVDPLEEGIGESTTEETTTEAPTVETEPQSYESNEFFDVVESAKVEKYGYTTIIHKVIAKKTTSIESSAIAYDSNGDVIGKSSDTISLVEGQTNYFNYMFEGDISDENLEITAGELSYGLWSEGDIDAVKLVKWNKKNDNLYLSFEQTGQLGSFSKFKVLLYKDGKIVGAEYGYFDIYASNLTGVGSTDVAEIWVYGYSFDDIEYIYEP